MQSNESQVENVNSELDRLLADIERFRGEQEEFRKMMEEESQRNPEPDVLTLQANYEMLRVENADLKDELAEVRRQNAILVQAIADYQKVTNVLSMMRGYLSMAKPQI